MCLTPSCPQADGILYHRGTAGMMSEVCMGMGVGVQGTLCHVLLTFPCCLKDQQSLTGVISGCRSLCGDRLDVLGSDNLGSWWLGMDKHQLFPP